MAEDDGFRRYLDAAESVAQATKDRAEEFVRELMVIGEEERDEGRDWVSDLVDRSRKASEALLDIVRTEISSQLGVLGVDSLEDMADRVADILRRSSDVGKAASTFVDAKVNKVVPTITQTAPAKKAPAKKAPAKKAPAKKAPAKKAPAKKAPAKKAATKKAPAKKAPAKKAAKRPSGSSS